MKDLEGKKGGRRDRGKYFRKLLYVPLERRVWQKCSGDKEQCFFHLSETPAMVKRGFLCAHDGNEPIVFLCFGEYSEDEV